MAPPKELGQIMDLAKNVEERNAMLTRPKGQYAVFGYQIVPGIHTNFRFQNPATWSKSLSQMDKNPSMQSNPSYRRDQSRAIKKGKRAFVIDVMRNMLLDISVEGKSCKCCWLRMTKW